MPDKFDIIISDLQKLATSGRVVGVFGEKAHAFQINPTLPEYALSDFERAYKVRLPDDYRQFLVRVGNGGAGPYYGLFRLGEVDDGFDFGPWDDFIGELWTPFPHTAAWNDVAGKPEYKEDDEQFDTLIEEFDKRYWDSKQVNGAIPVCHKGCALRQWLVITGPEAGNIWRDDRTDYKGLYPLQTEMQQRVTFFDWYRDWLDNALTKLERRENGSRG